MERWAANTLRTLGIILTAGFVLVTGLILLLLSMCAASGTIGGTKHPEQVAPYLICAGLILVFGILVIARLARSIFRSMKATEPADGNLSLFAPDVNAPSAPPAETPTPPTPESEVSVPPHAALLERPATPPLAPPGPRPPLPLHLSPLGRQAIDRLLLALGAQIFTSGVALTFNQLYFWSTPRIFAPLPFRNAGPVLIASFVLYHLPYAVLIYALLKRPDRRAFTYALAAPAVLIMQALLSLGYFALFAAQHPMSMLVLFVPWAIHIVILVLAYQAIQQVGLHPEPASLIVAAVVIFLFFSLIHVITPFLYRL